MDLARPSLSAPYRGRIPSYALKQTNKPPSTSTQPRRFYCDISKCKSSFCRPYDLARHQKSIHGPKKRCQHKNCRYRTGRVDKMREHERKIHKSTDTGSRSSNHTNANSTTTADATNNSTPDPIAFRTYSSTSTDQNDFGYRSEPLACFNSAYEDIVLGNFWEMCGPAVPESPGTADLSDIMDYASETERLDSMTASKMSQAAGSWHNGYAAEDSDIFDMVW